MVKVIDIVKELKNNEFFQSEGLLFYKNCKGKVFCKLLPRKYR